MKFNYFIGWNCTRKISQMHFKYIVTNTLVIKRVQLYQNTWSFCFAASFASKFRYFHDAKVGISMVIIYFQPCLIVHRYSYLYHNLIQNRN